MGRRGEKTADNMENGANAHHHLHDVGESDSSSSFSDAEDQSWHSTHDPHCVESSFNELQISYSCASLPEIAAAAGSCRDSCNSDCCLQIVMENGVPEIMIGLAKSEKNCRICQLSLEESPESGLPIELGCSCKHDLAAAHKQCAETWFRIKGNKVCEICGSTAKNVIVAHEIEIPEQRNEINSNPTPAPPTTQNRSFWQGHRFLNFLLACMVFAFIISWLFHFNVPG